MRSPLALVAALALAVALAGCRADPAGPPRVTTIVVPPGAPPKQLTACADGTWSTATGAWQPPRGYQRAAKARVAERDRRERGWHDVGYIVVGDALGACDVCGLPDSYRGQGDGIGSCDCPRCDCGVARSSSFCTCDPACSYCLSKTCEGDCDEAFADEPDDDAGHGDDWPPCVVSVPDISTWGQP